MRNRSSGRERETKGARLAANVATPEDGPGFSSSLLNGVSTTIAQMQSTVVGLMIIVLFLSLVVGMLVLT
jgi:hypothetical protein